MHRGTFTERTASVVHKSAGRACAHPQPRRIISPLSRGKESVLGKMAGRTVAAFYYLALIFHLVLLTECNFGVRYGDRARRLHVGEDGDSSYKRPLIINKRFADSRRPDEDGHETSFNERTRRDVPLVHPNNNPNITTKVRTLVGEGRRRRCVAIPRPLVPPSAPGNGEGKKRVNRRATYTDTRHAPPLPRISFLRNFSRRDRRDADKRGLCARSQPEHNCRIISLFRSKFNQSRRNGASRGPHRLY